MEKEKILVNLETEDAQEVQELLKYEDEYNVGYGLDMHSENAKELIKKHLSTNLNRNITKSDKNTQKKKQCQNYIGTAIHSKQFIKVT